MIIKFTNYSDEIHEFELSKSCEALKLGNPFRNDVLLKCRMDKSHSQIYLSCDLSVVAEMECDRCTNLFETKLKNHFENIYLFSRDEKNDDDINVYQLPPDSDKIDLSEDVIDFANLAIPMKNLCSEDCKGLCPRCGINLNEKKCNCNEDDSLYYWEPLQKLKDKSNKKT